MNVLENVDEEVKLDMIIEWLSKYLNQQDIVDIINKHLKELETETDDNGNPIEKDDDSDHELSSGEGPSHDFDFDIDINDNEEPENINVEETEEPEIAPQVNLTDIEGADLV